MSEPRPPTYMVRIELRAPHPDPGLMAACVMTGMSREWVDALPALLRNPDEWVINTDRAGQTTMIPVRSIHAIAIQPR